MKPQCLSFARAARACLWISATARLVLHATPLQAEGMQKPCSWKKEGGGAGVRIDVGEDRKRGEY